MVRSAVGLTWEEVLSRNVRKLAARYPERVFSVVRSVERREENLVEALDERAYRDFRGK